MRDFHHGLLVRSELFFRGSRLNTVTWRIERFAGGLDGSRRLPAGSRGPRIPMVDIQRPDLARKRKMA